MSHAPVGFLGLGVMGSAMSGHLLDAGFPVLGFDPDPEAPRLTPSAFMALASRQTRASRSR